MMNSKAYENVKTQVGYCGIWCGSCIVGNGMLKELSKRYEHLIGGYGINKWGAKDFDGKEFMKGLASIQTLPTCQGCRKGGGNEVCKMRPCASEKKLPDYIECDDTKCKNREALKKVREGALGVGMLAKADDDHSSHQQLIKKWTIEIETKCRTCGA
jgi:hypothetical protein